MSTHITSLGTHHYLPIVDEASRLRQCLVDNETRLQQVASDLAAALSAAARLRQECDDAQTRLSLLAPIWRVPVYIMQEIFFHCLPTDRYISPASTKAPLLLTQVCSSWRNLAISTPMLWSSLFVVLSPFNANERTRLVKLWLGRSGQRALCFNVYAPTVDSQLHPLLDLLAANIHRLNHLSLTIPSTHLSSVNGIINGNAPLLESVVITLSKGGTAGHPTRPLRITSKSATRLRSLSLCFRDQVMQSYSFNMTHILDLNIVQTTLTADQCLQLLAGCPYLKKAQLQVVNTPILEASESKCVTHHHLNSLEIHSMVSLGSFLDHLILPNLLYLMVADASTDLEGSTSSIVWQPSSFINFVGRSQCNITSLRFTQALESDDALISCLRATSHSLKELQVSDLRGVTFPITDRVLQLLTIHRPPNPQTPILCPRLETVRFGTCLSSTDGVLAQMLESRWYLTEVGTSEFARPKFMNPRLDVKRNPRDVAMLGKLRAAGLQIV